MAKLKFKFVWRFLRVPECSWWFREGSGKAQGRLRESSGKFSGRFREGWRFMNLFKSSSDQLTGTSQCLFHCFRHVEFESFFPYDFSVLSPYNLVSSNTCYYIKPDRDHTFLSRNMSGHNFYGWINVLQMYSFWLKTKLSHFDIFLPSISLCYN